jgi:hypothetical protein
MVALQFLMSVLIRVPWVYGNSVLSLVLVNTKKQCYTIHIGDFNFALSDSSFEITY